MEAEHFGRRRFWHLVIMISVRTCVHTCVAGYIYKQLVLIVREKKYISFVYDAGRSSSGRLCE